MRTGRDNGRPATGAPQNPSFTGAARGRRTHDWWIDMSRAWGRISRHPRLVAPAAVVVMAGAISVWFTATGTLSSSATRQSGFVHVTSATPRSAASPSSLGSTGGAAASDPASSGIVVCPMMPAVPNVAGESTGGSGSTNLGSATHLFTRTTADGVTIRAYRLSYTEPCTCGPIPASLPSSGSLPGFASPGTEGLAADSSVTSAVSVELSDNTAVGQGVLSDAPGTEATTATVTNAATEPLAATSGAFGVVEGAPVWWIAVSVGSEVAGVQVAFADGSTDQMSAVGGVAVVAHQIDPSVATSGDGPYEVSATLQLLDDSGAVINTVTFPEPSPTSVPEPTPEPGTPPEPVPGSTSSTSSTSMPTLVSPLATSGAMIACPDTQPPDLDR